MAARRAAVILATVDTRRSHGHSRSPRARRTLAPAVLAAVAAVAATTLAGCGAGHSGTAPHPGTPTSARARATTTRPPSGTSAATTTVPAAGAGREGVPAFAHLFVVVMENLDRQEALAVPAVAALAHRYASADAWYAVAHPSLPNYLALASGSTWGVSSDCTSCIQTGANLATQLSAAGIPWGAYFEGMPGNCFLGPQSPDGSYAAKHDPFAYFTDVRADPSVCAHLQPLHALTPLLAPGAPASGVPRFVWVTPDLCHSGHDCGAAAGGAWLSGFVATVTTSAAWADNGALVVTWDEGADSASASSGAITDSGGGGNVLTLVIAPHVRAGLRVGTLFDHYSFLRTVEDAFGLPLLGGAAARTTVPMSAFWAGTGP